MRRVVFRLVLLGLFSLLSTACGGGGGGGSSWSPGPTGGRSVDPGESGYGPGPAAQGATPDTTVLDLRGVYTITQHDVVEENCTEQTSESDYLVGKRMTLTMYQEGKDLHAVYRSAEPGDEDIEPMSLFGFATSGGFSLSGENSASESDSQQGYSIRMSATAVFVTSGTVTGNALSATMDVDLSGSVSIKGPGVDQSQPFSCAIRTSYGGTRDTLPPGVVVGSPDAGGGVVVSDAGVVVGTPDAGGGPVDVAVAPSVDVQVSSFEAALTAAPTAEPRQLLGRLRFLAPFLGARPTR